MTTPNDNDPFSSLRPRSESNDLTPPVGAPEAPATKEITSEPRDEEKPLPSTAEMAPGTSPSQETADYVARPVAEQSTGDYAPPTRQTAAPLVRPKKSAEEEPMPEVPGYELLGVLGRGGMGVVYKARQQGLKRLVALKMIRDARLAGPDDLARFHIEAEAIAALHHPNIVQIYEIGEHDRLPYFSLEFVDGGNLGKTLARKPQPARWSAEMLETLARGMEAAHSKGIIHRDLKPANVLMTKAGEPKITDFGLAKQLQEESEQTRTGDIMGTPNYMPPEQAQGRLNEIGPVSDVWSLGVILYEALTGRLPFLGETVMDTFVMIATSEPVAPRTLQPKLPRDLETICLKCLEKTPAKRYASAEALAEDLRRWLNGEPIVARPASVFERSRKLVARNKAKSAAIAALVFALFCVIGGVIANLHQQAETYRLQVFEQDRLLRANDTVALRIAEAETAIKQLDFIAAQKAASGALQQIQADPATLARYKETAEQLLTQAEKGLAGKDEENKSNERNDRYWANDNEAQLYATLYTGLDLLENRKRLLAQAQAALDVFGWRDRADPAVVQNNPYIKAPEKARLLASGADLFLMLAQDALRDKTPDAARRAESYLENAARLQEPGPGFLFLKADCRALRDDPTGARKARLTAEKMMSEIKENKRGGSARDYFLLGLREYYQQNISAAIEHFDASVGEQSNYFWAHYYRGICNLQFQDGSADAAATSLTACIGLRDKFIWNYLLRGYAYGQLAARVAEHGDVEVAQGYFARAEKDFAKAEELGPNETERYILLTNRGVSRYFAKTWPGAIADLEAAIKLQPENFQAYNNLAQVYTAQKDYDKALALLDKAISAKPQGLPGLYRHRAQINRKRKDFEAALADSTAAFANDPPDSPSRGNDQLQRAQALLALKRYSEALAACDTALKDNARSTTAYQVKAAVLLELSRYDDALEAYDRYIEYSRREVPPDIYEARGLVRQQLRDPAGAIEDFTRALAVRENLRTMRDRGWAYLVTDVPRLALSDFQHVIDKDHDNADAYAGRGYCRAKLGQTTPAIADAEEALQRSPKDARTTYNAARIYGQVVARLDEQRGPRDPGLTDLRLRWNDRALALLAETMKLLPPAEREKFWRESVSRDLALVMVRRSVLFVRLEQEYGKPTPRPEAGNPTKTAK